VDFLLFSARIKPMINKDDVKNIAKLARLSIAEGETDKLQKDLSAILDFIEKLKEVDVEGVQITAQATGLENKMRQDQSEKEEDEKRKNILENVPERKEDYIKVKTILE
jgi:aspartyl-tRNA(Asn)/glutamyl-tRNA(Gln) amidotransferase subunit C